MPQNNRFLPDKYTINTLNVLFGCISLGVSFTVLLFMRELAWYVGLGIFLVIIWSLHILFNAVHQASHYQLRKNKRENALFGSLAALFCGITFADFQETHLVHHRYPNHPTKDPDYVISHYHNFFILPFKIFWHDIFFWKNNLWRNHKWIHYIVTRALQCVLVGLFVLTGNGVLFLLFWAIPMYILGFCNGLFLFYLPHNTLKIETKLNQLPLIKTIILLSRYSHELHHHKVSHNLAYFPGTLYLRSIFSGSWQNHQQSFTGDYLNLTY